MSNICLNSLTVSYDKEPVWKDFSLTLPEEGIVAIMGPSGRGKTTLLRVLAGLLTPQKGQLTGIAGKKIAMVFQEDRLLPWLTALENVLSVLPGKNPQQEEALARSWLEKMELGDCLHVYPEALSGGMQRRVALARAFAYGGDILLMDEPFKGLDEALLKRVLQHVPSAAPLIVLVTHEPQQAEALGAKLIQL